MTLARRFIRLAALYGGVIAIALFLDNPSELIPVGESRSWWSRSLSLVGFKYQSLMATGPRKPRPHFVRLVTLSPEVEPGEVLANRCEQRAYLARVLRVLAHARPAVVVLDKYFSPDACREGDAGTEALRVAVADLSRVAPVIVGRNSTDVNELLRDGKRIDLAPDVEVLRPTLDFEGVTYGLVRLNADPRKIPLAWPIYPSLDEADSGPTKPMQGLAVAVAQRYDGAVSKAIAFDGRHPYTTLMPEESFKRYSALSLICGVGAQVGDWRTCTSGDNAAIEGDLAHRIVLVGERAPQDMYDTVAGHLPGMVLQANYIEALLDDRYLKPAPTLVLVVLNALWFCAIEFAFLRWAASPRTAIAAAVSVNVFVGFVLYYVMTVNFGLYLALVPPAMLAAVGRYVTVQLARRAEDVTPAKTRRRVGKKRLAAASQDDGAVDLGRRR